MAILGTEDRLEILELYARYCHAFDSGEPERWAALFTRDGTFTVQPGGGVQSRKLRGTEELEANVRKGHEDSFKRRGIRHQVSNVIIECSDTGVKGTAYVTAVTVGEAQPPQIVATGRYVDELTKEPDGWRFRSRTFMPDS